MEVHDQSPDCASCKNGSVNMQSARMKSIYLSTVTPDAPLRKKNQWLCINLPGESGATLTLNAAACSLLVPTPPAVPNVVRTRSNARTYGKEIETCVPKSSVRLWRTFLEWEFADQDRQNEAYSEQNSAWDEMMASHGFMEYIENGIKISSRQ